MRKREVVVMWQIVIDDDGTRVYGPAGALVVGATNG